VSGRVPFLRIRGHERGEENKGEFSFFYLSCLPILSLSNTKPVIKSSRSLSSYSLPVTQLPILNMKKRNREKGLCKVMREPDVREKECNRWCIQHTHVLCGKGCLEKHRLFLLFSLFPSFILFPSFLVLCSFPEYILSLLVLSPDGN